MIYLLMRVGHWNLPLLIFISRPRMGHF
jgi:hypothetical protein